MDLEKIAIIQDYGIPRTLEQLRSFIKLTGRYKGFIRNYAKIMRPLTIQLTIKNINNKIEIDLGPAALVAFKEIKNVFQKQIKLHQPDFSKPFELIIETSNFTFGAILSQDRHPITFISRILSPTEFNYTTNEKEILNIVWALQKLKNYANNEVNLTIYTNFQNLKHWISEENPNTKLEEWRKKLLRDLVSV